MELVFHLRIPYDARCVFANLYAVTSAPKLVAVSVHNKMIRENNIGNLVEFVRQIRDCNPAV